MGRGTSELRTARSHLVHLVRRQVAISCTAILGLEARVASLGQLVGSTGASSGVNLVQAIGSVLAALRVDGIDGGGQAVQDVGDAVGEAGDDTADNALENGLEVLGGAREDVLGGSEDVFDVSADVARLVVEEAG